MTLYSNEFEGLVAFEEISSYKIAKPVKRKRGAIGIVTKTVKDGTVVKKVKTKKNKPKAPESIEKRTKNEAPKEALQKAKKKRRLAKVSATEDEPPNKKVCLKDEKEADREGEKEAFNSSAWRSIFTPEPVIKAVEKLGFAQPTEIQRLTIPAAVQGHKDIVGAAETGSGKTLAFGIPIIHGILIDKLKEKEAQGEPESSAEGGKTEEHGDQSGDSEAEPETGDEEDGNDDSNSEMESSGIGCVKVIDNANFDFLEDASPTTEETKNKKPLRALVITPTRELAVQIQKHLDALLGATDITTAVVIGGLSQEKQERLLLKGPDIVIGTPGRLWQMIQQGNLHLGQMQHLKYLAIDEADRLLESGHFEEVKKLLSLLKAEESQRQNFIFSATLTLEHDIPERFSRKFKKKKVTRVTAEAKLANLVDLVGLKPKHKVVDTTLRSKTAQHLSEGKVMCDEDEKEYFLYYFFRSFPGRTLVFCNSIDCVRRLNNLFALLNCNPQALHASKHQKQRLKSLERFTSSREALLLATDVAARGLDIPDVDHILHYEVPKTAETYIHRSGRTARAQKGGLSILLLSPSEVGRYRKICSTLERSSDLAPFPVDHNIVDQIKERVNLAKRIETAEFRLRKNNFEEKWMKKISDDSSGDFTVKSTRKRTIEEEELSSHHSRLKKQEAQQVRAMRRQLTEALSRPFLSTNFSSKYPTLTGSLVIPFQRATPLQPTNSALKLFNKESKDYSKMAETVKFKPAVNKSDVKKEKEAKKRQRRLKKRKANRNKRKN